jgi:hypothetical protein
LRPRLAAGLPLSQRRLVNPLPGPQPVCAVVAPIVDRVSRSTTCSTVSGVLKKRCGARHRFMARSSVRRLFNSSRAIPPPVCRRVATTTLTTNTTNVGGDEFGRQAI